MPCKQSVVSFVSFEEYWPIHPLLTGQDERVDQSFALEIPVLAVSRGVVYRVMHRVCSCPDKFTLERLTIILELPRGLTQVAMKSLNDN